MYIFIYLSCTTIPNTIRDKAKTNTMCKRSELFILILYIALQCFCQLKETSRSFRDQERDVCRFKFFYLLLYKITFTKSYIFSSTMHRFPVRYIYLRKKILYEKQQSSMKLKLKISQFHYIILYHSLYYSLYYTLHICLMKLEMSNEIARRS